MAADLVEHGFRGGGEARGLLLQPVGGEEAGGDIQLRGQGVDGGLVGFQIERDDAGDGLGGGAGLGQGRVHQINQLLRRTAPGAADAKGEVLGGVMQGGAVRPVLDSIEADAAAADGAGRGAAGDEGREPIAHRRARGRAALDGDAGASGDPRHRGFGRFGIGEAPARRRLVERDAMDRVAGGGDCGGRA